MNIHATFGRPLQFASPFLVFGGPYSNLEALEALLREAARLGVPRNQIICTGDVVAYCADAAACVDTIRASGIHVIMGNCEESLALAAGDCGCGFIPGSSCEKLSAAWFEHADRTIDADARAWMAGLPHSLMIEASGMRIAVIHGGATRINRFIFSSTSAQIKAAELDHLGADGVIGGHCGLPFTQSIGSRFWHNAGTIGVPANDGTPRVWFSVFRPEGERLWIEHRELEYDHRAAASKMYAAGLPPEYAESLATGLWPSCDILPYREITERGVALVPGTCLIERHERADADEKSARAKTMAATLLWPAGDRDNRTKLAKNKFTNTLTTADGKPRASVALHRLDTLWVNTGTLCNIACSNCYIESGPRNDRLAYITQAEVSGYLDEIERDGLETVEIGFTGGEPFMNPEFLEMLEEVLSRGYRALVLTNAMKPMQRFKLRLLELNARYAHLLSLRISLDHYTPERHEEERGTGSFAPTVNGMKWLSDSGFRLSAAGRTMWNEQEGAARAGFAKLFAAEGIDIDAFDPAALVLFPEMDETVDVPEITTACWNILHKSPGDLMCSSSRMVVKRKGAGTPTVLACTLIPYDQRFELGPTLRDASKPIHLNHPHCARFCVLGGASCVAPATSGKNDASGIKKESAFVSVTANAE